MSNAPWWRGAIIYQIYPRSFLDTDGDGVGDLPGIVERLDYVAELGVDAIWVAPFFKSPMADFGYDIADYREVDPLFGTLEDFDRLLHKAHGLGLKVMIDQVLSHTSAEHAWFRESRQSRDNPKADWYVWADARPDGTPPNNWLSLFGGSAWQWEPRRGQYYLHNFLASQPDLNFHHPDVRAATLDNVRFWLDKGVDGIRLDAINFCFHDRQLRDNPPKPSEQRVGRGFSPANPYAFQYHYYNNTQPENLGFLAELRALMDGYADVAALGEISSEDSLGTMAEYTMHGRLHMGYSFELLTEDFSAAHIRGTVRQLEAQMTEGWPCWAISNHDVERVLSRVLAAVQGPRRLPHADAVERRGRASRFQPWHAVAARARGTSRPRRGATAGQPAVRAQRLPHLHALAPGTPGAALGRHRIPRCARTGAGLPAPAAGRHGAGGVQPWRVGVRGDIAAAARQAVSDRRPWPASRHDARWRPAPARPWGVVRAAFLTGRTPRAGARSRAMPFTCRISPQELWRERAPAVADTTTPRRRPARRWVKALTCADPPWPRVRRGTPSPCSSPATGPSSPAGCRRCRAAAGRAPCR